MIFGSKQLRDSKVRVAKDHGKNTLYNVCSVHRGMFSTSGGVQYIGGCSVHLGDIMVHRADSVHRGVFSTSGGVHTSGCHEWGISVHRGDIMSTSGDIQYIGDIMMNVGGYHEYIGGVQYSGGLP